MKISKPKISNLQEKEFIDVTDNIYDNYHFTNNSTSNIEIKNTTFARCYICWMRFI